MAHIQNSASSSSSGRSTIRSGVYETTPAMNFTDKTVAEAREALAKMWKIESDSTAIMNKQELADDYVIQAGDQIELVKRQGEKGR